MEKERIVKALEWCSDDNSVCLHCPARERCNNDSMFLEREALSLIREQEKRIEEIKADTVLKMQEAIKERCIKGGIYPAFVARTIENVARELLEEDKTHERST